MTLEEYNDRLQAIINLLGSDGWYANPDTLEVFFLDGAPHTITELEIYAEVIVVKADREAEEVQMEARTVVNNTTTYVPSDVQGIMTPAEIVVVNTARANALKVIDGTPTVIDITALTIVLNKYKFGG